MKSARMLVHTLFILSASISRMEAADIFDTVNSTAANVVPRPISGGASSKFLASTFLVDPGYQATINSITLKLMKGALEGDVAATFKIGIYRSGTNSFAPESFVTGGDFGSQVVTSTALALTTFTPAQPLTLQGDYRYWVMMGVATTTTTPFYQSSLTGGTPAQQVQNLAPTVGLSWNNSADMFTWYSAATDTVATPISSVNLTGGNVTGGNIQLFSLAGTVTAVPEPGTWAMASLAVMALLVYGQFQVTHRERIRKANLESA